MSDPFVRRVLSKWKMEKYIPLFEEEEIDEESFRVLTPVSIERLFVKIGPRDKFLANWKREFGSSEPMFSSVEVSCSENSSNAVEDIDERILRLQSANNDLSSSEADPLLKNEVDVYAILKNVIEGRAAVKYYKEKKTLTNEHRLNVADIIIRHELKEENEFCINSKRLIYLASRIVETFPNESTSTYYIPFTIHSVTRKPILARGKLHAKYYLLREKLKKAGEVLGNERNYQKSKKVDLPEPRDLILATHEQLALLEGADDHELRELSLWLETHTVPWVEVMKKWIQTSKYRIQKLASDASITNRMYMNMYKSLQLPIGYELIEADFELIYPNQTNIITSEWPGFEKEVLACAVSRKGNEVKDLLDQYRLVNNDAQAAAAIVLRLLPLLLPCQAVKGALSKPLWKLNRLESQDAFLLHIKNISELKNRLDCRREKLKIHGMAEQPLVVVVGETLLNLEAAYVCVSDTCYKFSSVLKAFEIAFKSFYALQLPYPKEVEHSWQIVQFRIFGIGEENEEEMVESVTTLLADLRNVLGRFPENLASVTIKMESFD
ncbi:uncharacterized protein LOC122512279 [Leptopilina heterotoma]|uniref:uncharacterized protein LOC122512279 n=1 Tax=Leptopilina heterotoma TaxID=63436 RepID=UPI001CA95591|nr:uncharacterized protein LOC122512279 [Leptopilina heterotoma]